MLNTKPWRDMLADARNALTTTPAAKVRTLRPFLPYCWAYDEGRALVLVNRAYKPLGLNTGAWVDYGNFPSHRVPGPEVLPPKAAALLHHSPAGLFFFADRCAPWCSKADARRLIEVISAHLAG